MSNTNSDIIRNDTKRKIAIENNKRSKGGITMAGDEYTLSDAEKEVMKKRIRTLIRTCKKFNINRAKVKAGIVREYEISEQAAEEYLKKYW